MKELFDKFVENRCPTFWQRVEEGGRCKDREEFFRITDVSLPGFSFAIAFSWLGTIEGYDYWREVRRDWKYIVRQDKKKRDKIARLFEEFIENRCPTFWQRVEEGGWYKDKEDFILRQNFIWPYSWVGDGFACGNTIEGYDYWEEVALDWIYIVDQEEKKQYKELPDVAT